MTQSKEKTITKYIPVGCINDDLGIYHHVDSVYFQNYVVSHVSSGVNGDKYPVIAYIKLICDTKTGDIISVELIKE